MKTIAITGGKGGCGKTNLSANLGIALAQLGQSVTVFDADLGLANLDIVLGVRSEFTLQDVLSGDKLLTEIVTPGPGGVQFIPGGSGVKSLLTVGPKKLKVFLSQVPELAATTDILIFDTGAGIDPKVTSFLRASDETVLITTPDPACVIDSYATVKTLLRLDPSAKVRVILNMVKHDAQAAYVFNKLQGIVSGFLTKELVYGGSVRMDLRAQEFIRRRVPFVLGDPSLPASQDVKSAAASLLTDLASLHENPFLERLQQSFEPLSQAA